MTAITRLTAHFTYFLMWDLVICKIRISMHINDIECPYWGQLSIHNTSCHRHIASTDLRVRVCVYLYMCVLGGAASCGPFCGPFALIVWWAPCFLYSFYLYIYLFVFFLSLFCLGGRKTHTHTHTQRERERERERERRGGGGGDLTLHHQATGLYVSLNKANSTLPFEFISQLDLYMKPILQAKGKKGTGSSKVDNKQA